MAVTHDFATLNDCDDATDWTESGDAITPTDDTTTFKEGTGSVNMGKTGGGADETMVYNATITSTNVDNKVTALWIYVGSQDVLDDLSIARAYLIDSDTDWAYIDLFNYNSQVLQLGWNMFAFGNKKGYTATSSFNVAAVVGLRLYFETNNAADAIAIGDIKMDYWVLGTYVQYTGGSEASPVTMATVKSELETAAIPVFKWGGGKYMELWAKLILSGGISDSNYFFYVCPLLNKAYMMQFDGVVFTLTQSMIALRHYGGSFDSESIISELSNSTVNWTDVFLCYLNEVGAGPTFYGIGNFTRCTFYQPVGSTRTMSLPMATTSNLTFHDCTFYGGITMDGGSGRTWSFTGDNTWVTWGSARSALYVRQTQDMAAEADIVKDIKLNGWTIGFNLVCGLWVRDVRDTVTITGTITNPIIKEDYTFNPHFVDEDGNAIANGVLKVYGSVSTYGDTLLYDGATDASGYPTPAAYILRRYQYLSGTVKDEVYTTHRVYLEDSGGNKVLDYPIDIDHKIDQTEIATNQTWRAKVWTNNSFYQRNENVILYAEVYDWAGNKLTTYTPTCVITKPDATTDTPTFADNGVYPDATSADGTYTGAYTSTDLAGTYRVVITIAGYGGNDIVAEASFEVKPIRNTIEIG